MWDFIERRAYYYIKGKVVTNALLHSRYIATLKIDANNFEISPSKGSEYKFLRSTSKSSHGSHFVHVISSGNILRASRTHSIVYVIRGGLFAIFAGKGAH